MSSRRFAGHLYPYFNPDEWDDEDARFGGVSPYEVDPDWIPPPRINKRSPPRRDPDWIPPPQRCAHVHTPTYDRTRYHGHYDVFSCEAAPPPPPRPRAHTRTCGAPTYVPKRPAATQLPPSILELTAKQREIQELRRQLDELRAQQLNYTMEEAAMTASTPDAPTSTNDEI